MPRTGVPIKTLSIVTPVFNEQECLPEFYRRLTAALANCGLEAYEIILVDDGSLDRTPAILAELVEKDARIKVLTLSRNFGHHPAVFAGLAVAVGEAVVIVDADLQDPPELVPRLLAERNNGYELVFARRRVSEGEPILLRFLKRRFRVLMKRLSNIDFPDDVGVFSVMDRPLKELLLTMPERERYLVAMQMYLGYRVGFVDYDRAPRQGGTPKQTLRRLFRLGMNSIFSYSSLPLQFSMIASCACLVLAAAGISYVLYAKFISNVAIVGWASVMTAILGMGAVQLFSLWIVCEYVDRIFENVKGRPYYVVRSQQGVQGMDRCTEGDVRRGA
ncbi:MAG: glycosyltransferase family 2 protein [Nitrospira sp.]|nr:glycosyltransferase family 2 protein [Nitrospira sp.]